MSVRLFVGNLPYDVTEAELRELLSAAGPPGSVRIPTDRETGKPRGFAFVEFSDAAQAEEAVRRFHQQVFKGRPLVVNEARPREEGFASRPNAFAPGGRSGSLGPTERGPRPDQPTRSFGPDAKPRSQRKPRGHSPKGERAPKGPMRERTGGQFFYGNVDDSQDDQEVDDVAFWDRAATENTDTENTDKKDEE
jgi:RNA recognition motif-containing protein